MANTLCKAERLNSKILIEKMFAGGSKSFSIFPLRVVYMPVENQDVQASILLSVSKKRFKRAVKRNRVKRYWLVLVRNWYETPVVIYIVASYLLLQSMHFAHDSSFMSFHSYLFAIRY